MSTYAKNNFKSLNYNSFRPHYPPSFYNILGSYINKGPTKVPVQLAVDLGCGTGVATYPLLNIAQRVIGSDLSPTMIETANSLVKPRCKELGIKDTSVISFEAGAVEDLLYKKSAGLSDGTVDLITAAECIHWFTDYDQFFKSSATLLKKGGVLAYFFYVDPDAVDFTGPSKLEKLEALKKAKEIYYKYVYNDPQYMGPHWEQPGRNIIKNRYVDVDKHIPQNIYTDVVINRFEPDFANGKLYASENDLDLKKESISLERFMSYLRTSSAYHNFKDATGDKEDIFEKYVSELENEIGWDRNETKIDVVWNTGYTFLRKK